MLAQTIDVLMQYILWHGSKNIDPEPAKQHALQQDSDWEDNADAAAAINDSLGQQSDPWRQEQAQQKLSTLSLHHTKVCAAQMWLTDLLRPSTHCKALQFAQRKRAGSPLSHPS